MKSSVILDSKQVAWLRKRNRYPQHGEVLLKIKHVGFCGSDLNTFLGRNPMVKMPVIPGHEISAVVEKTTTGVPDTIREGMPCNGESLYQLWESPVACRNGRVQRFQFKSER